MGPPTMKIFAFFAFALALVAADLCDTQKPACQAAAAAVMDCDAAFKTCKDNLGAISGAIGADAADQIADAVDKATGGDKETGDKETGDKETGDKETGDTATADKDKTSTAASTTAAFAFGLVSAMAL